MGRSIRGGLQEARLDGYEAQAFLKREKQRRGQLFHCPNQFITSGPINK